MGNPYTEPTISGYNASPPPDDGSQTASNEITWAGTKTKLADPIKTYADAINSNVLAAFAKMFLCDISSISTNYTVVSGDQGKILACSGTITVTLPAAATIGKPFVIFVKNVSTGVVTLAPNGTEQIDGSNTSIPLQPGGWACVATDATGWRTAGINNTFTASLGADVLLNNTATFFDGPSVAQGTVGTWSVSATVTVTDTASSAAFELRLWDGTTTIASGETQTFSSGGVMMATISGVITNPAGNIRISVADTSATTGKILHNNTSLGKDSTITATRIS